MKQIKEQGGITLIALVVTIVVLLILAGVSVNVIIGDIEDEGIIQKAKNAQNKMDEATQNDLDKIDELNTIIGHGSGENNEPIDTETSYVGYYADFEGDGEVDGIIYADLAIGASGQWENSNGKYSYSAVTDKTTLKDYYISKESYKPKNAEGEELAFEAKPVLTPIAGEKAERFYVMELSDVTSTETTNNYFCWYDAAYDSGISEYASITSTAFGDGKNNTTVMINSWNDSAYGAQNHNRSYLDMWGVIQDECSGKWFVPSRQEWSAFAQNLGITSGNYGKYGLRGWYWTSSLIGTIGAWIANFDGGFMYGNYLGIRKLAGGTSYFDCSVRLSATF